MGRGDCDPILLTTHEKLHVSMGMGTWPPTRPSHNLAQPLFLLARMTTSRYVGFCR